MLFPLNSLVPSIGELFLVGFGLILGVLHLGLPKPERALGEVKYIFVSEFDGLEGKLSHFSIL